MKETNKQKSHPYSLEQTSTKTYCCCKDSNGESKYLYHSQKEIEYILTSKQVSLTSFHCPYEKGWHITKG